MNTGLVPSIVAGCVLTMLLIVLSVEFFSPPPKPASVRHVVVRGHWVELPVRAAP